MKEEYIVIKEGREGKKYRGQLQVLIQDKMVEAMKLHKTSVDEFLIKIVESALFHVNVGVLN